ncbi:hypothetical protein Tco_1084348 [Tanacetum coccineum]
MSWGWRKVLQSRPLIRQYVWYSIGDGASASLWFDNWCVLSPLAEFIPSRDWYRAGLSSLSTVSDVIHNGVWNWPLFLSEKYPMLITLPSPSMHLESDHLERRNDLGVVKPFSVSMVWSTIRPMNVKVDWFEVVWFPFYIPCHAFNLWLVVKQRLKTQDKVASWEVSDSLMSVCLLCELVSDSHEHIFFEYSFSQQVWNHMKAYAGLPNSSHVFSQILLEVSPFAKRKSSRSVIAKLVLAASAYFLWQERNWRLFKNSKKTAKQVIDCIYSSVRPKLLSCRFKKSKHGVSLAQRWSLPDSCFAHSS